MKYAISPFLREFVAYNASPTLHPTWLGHGMVQNGLLHSLVALDDQIDIFQQ